jgi:hypothetical protein
MRREPAAEPAMTTIIAPRGPQPMVDIAWREPGGGPEAAAVAFRLVGSGQDVLLCLRPAGLPWLPRAAIAAADGEGMVILRLAELAKGLAALLPDSADRHRLLDALRRSLEDWPPPPAASPPGRLRAALQRALAETAPAGAPPPPARHAPRGAPGTRADETSLEALYRALHFCRQRAGGHA